jgi:hypothetical protein
VPGHFCLWDVPARRSISTDLPWWFQRNAHLDQRAVRPSRHQPVPEWCAAKPISGSGTARCAGSATSPGPYGLLRRLDALHGKAGAPIGTHGGPRYPIDLGGAMCPMGPEGGNQREWWSSTFVDDLVW